MDDETRRYFVQGCIRWPLGTAGGQPETSVLRKGWGLMGGRGWGEGLQAYGMPMMRAYSHAYHPATTTIITSPRP